MYPDPGSLASENSDQMIRFNLFRFLSGKKCSSICPEKTTENSIQMASALDKYVSSVCKSALFHLWNIPKIRMYLTSESTKTLVHAYVTCRLDNCNSLLLGSPRRMIQKLQRVQNCAACVVAGQPRRTFAPSLRSYTGCPCTANYL